MKFGTTAMGLLQSLFDFYDTAKAHMTPQNSLLTGTGINQIKSRSYSEAANSFSQALQIDQNNVVALNARGLIDGIYYNDFNSALSYFDQALQIDSSNLITLEGKGISLAKIGNYADALQYYNNNF
jgi:Flp pilus assembly protein TadD